MVRSYYKRLDTLDDEQLQQELSSAPAEIAIVLMNEVFCKRDWDSYETSWNFKRNPLV